MTRNLLICCIIRNPRLFHGSHGDLQLVPDRKLPRLCGTLQKLPFTTSLCGVNQLSFWDQVSGTFCSSSSLAGTSCSGTTPMAWCWPRMPLEGRGLNIAHTPEKGRIPVSSVTNAGNSQQINKSTTLGKGHCRDTYEYLFPWSFMIILFVLFCFLKTIFSVCEGRGQYSVWNPWPCTCQVNTIALTYTSNLILRFLIRNYLGGTLKWKQQRFNGMVMQWTVMQWFSTGVT